MQRISLLFVCLAMIAVGCAEAPRDFGPPQKPEPAAEMDQLKCMLGHWSGTGKIVEPTPEEMKAMMPEGAEEMPESFASEHSSDFALGGLFLRSEGWHEMGPDEKAHFVEYVTWDAGKGKFHSWYFSDWGEYGEGWMTWDANDRTFHFTGKGRDSEGDLVHGHGYWKVVDDDTAEWAWTEKGRMGQMKFEGTSKREP